MTTSSVVVFPNEGIRFEMEGKLRLKLRGLPTDVYDSDQGRPIGVITVLLYSFLTLGVSDLHM